MPDMLKSPIHTYAPMQEGEKYVAIIKGFPFYFTSDTALGARKKANDFRLVETWKVRGDKFPEELREQAVQAKLRIDARKVAK